VNTAHLIALMLQVQHLAAGHIHRVIYWISCYSHPPTQTITQLNRAGCIVIRFAPHSIRMTW
jgi:hypothetical protein